MGWACPRDHTPLDRTTDAWSCPACGLHYPVIEGIAVFADRDAADPAQPALVEELARALREPAPDAAVDAVCRTHGCVRTRFASSWKSFFSPRPGGTTLELGAGIGDDTLDLADRSSAVVALVPSLTHGRIVKRNLDNHSRTNCDVAVVTDLSRLPLRDASIDAVAMEDLSAGFAVGRAELQALAGELRRVIAPQGAVFVGTANRLHGLPGMAWVRRAVRARPSAPPLQRAVKRAGPPVRIGPQRLRRQLGQAGLEAGPIYAPLPDPDDAQIVLPVEDARAVRYFLDNLVRQNSGPVRLAVRLARLLVALRLFPRVVPYYYLIFRGAGRP